VRGCKISSFVYSPRGRGGAIGWFKGFDLLGRRWGIDCSTVYVEEERYLDRWIVYLNGYTLRLHRFWRGDDDRASHTHPWWFITFPMASYLENTYSHGRLLDTRVVRRWRFHYRPADFEHYVLGRMYWFHSRSHAFSVWNGKPWYTIVIAGPKRDTWGFYPEPGKFIRHDKWV
jgi:hypothetical protein